MYLYRIRMQYKVDTLCYKYIHRSGPCYLCDCIHLYTPSHTPVLHHAPSAAWPQTLSSSRSPDPNFFTLGSHSFSFFGPSTWNKLPLSLQQSPALDSFKSKLKTHFFSHQLTSLLSRLTCICFFCGVWVWVCVCVCVCMHAYVHAQVAVGN